MMFKPGIVIEQVIRFVYNIFTLLLQAQLGRTVVVVEEK